MYNRVEAGVSPAPPTPPHHGGLQWAVHENAQTRLIA
jgi:hypothetical protein